MDVQLSVQKILMHLFPHRKKHTSEEYWFSREVSQAVEVHDSVRLAEILQWERRGNIEKRDMEQNACVLCLLMFF